MLFEAESVENIIQHGRNVPRRQRPKIKEEYIQQDLFEQLVNRAEEVDRAMTHSLRSRKHVHYQYSPTQAERFLTVVARKDLATLNVELFDVLFVYLTRTLIGKSLLKHCNSVAFGIENDDSEIDVSAQVVRAWREAMLPVKGFCRFNDAVNKDSNPLIKVLPSNSKFTQYHAAIVPFIKYSLKIQPFQSHNITAISPCLALKLLDMNQEGDVFNKDFVKLWWDDRRVNNSKGIITLSKNGSSFKKDILVVLLSSIKLKDLMKSEDVEDQEVLTSITGEIQQIMKDPKNYCSSDLLAMKEILNPNFKESNQSPTYW